jgi:hypothetical protein
MATAKPRKLTDNQIHALQQIHTQSFTMESWSTRRTLIKRGLINEFGTRLTDAGREALIEIRDKRDRDWTPQQVRDFTRDAIAKVGRDGWALLVPDLRVAVIRAKALTVVTSQARDTVRTRAVELLACDMLAEAGLAEES